ncbi:MAG: family 10 glycosylhydrolase [Verrucomicrobia bacterium]|nr:family 10 glycosylhydrolase [Verrucomicrobiota bacterium]
MKAVARSYFVLLVFAFLTVPAFASTDEFRAFWVTGWNPGFLNQSQVETLLGVVGDPNSKGAIREANCNAVIVQVRRRFDVCYPSGVGEPYMGGLSPSTFNALEAMIKAAHDTTGGKKRIEVHCWSVVFKTNKGPVYNQHRDTPTGSLTNFDNYWPTRLDSVNGAENASGAFDPGHPKVLEYLVNAHMDLVNFQTTAGPDGTDGHIDGIHYDYIRFEGNNEGFNPTSVNRYKARYGLVNDPVSSDEQFKQWRRDQVTTFVRQMYARIQKAKPSVKHSGSFITWNPSPVASTRNAFKNTRSYYDVYSDWDSWNEEGIIDMAVPMTYYRQHEHPADYIKWMNFQKDRKFNRHMVVGPGTYLNTFDNAILHLNMTRDQSPAGNYAHGFAGYVYHLPYAGGNWPTFSPTLLSDVTPTWADIPEMPWKTTPTTAHIMGTVTDAHTDAWADHAVVSLTGSVNRSMYVDGTGFYAFIDLPPGTYNVTASKAGYQNALGTINVAVGAVTGNMYEQNLVLTTNTSPSIITHPISQIVHEGTNVIFSVVALGSEPLSYQWQRGGTNLTGAIGTSVTLDNVTTNDGAAFSVVITNAFGIAESDQATLIVLPPQMITGATLLWKLNQDDRLYFSADHKERGLSYNPDTGNLLFIGRAPTTAVHVLDGDNGDDLHTLTITTNVTGGFYPLQMIGVADDGAVYAGNLTLANSTEFRLYRWANDGASTEPTVAFSGDPGLGNNQRWGDTLDVRGKGSDTQVLLASRLGNMVSILTTTNGVDFAANPITVPGVPNGSFGLGVAFGRDNTVWGKTTNEPLRQVSFDLNAGTGAVVRTISSPAIPETVAPIGVNPRLDLLGGISFETPDQLKLFDLAGDIMPPVLAATTFPTAIPNAFFVGSVDFGRDRVYALNPNNGIIALQLNFPTGVAPTITKAEPLSSNSIGLWFNAERRPYIVEASSDLIQWNTVTYDIPQDGYMEFNDSASDAARFYRLVAP